MILNEGHSVGLEKEFYVVGADNNTYEQAIVKDSVIPRMKAELGAYDESWGPKCYIDVTGPLEVVTRPCSDLRQLSDDITTAYRIAQEESDDRGLYTLGMGSRPGKPSDQAGLHVHVGFKDEAEAEYVFNELQKHVPDIMALSANSPSRFGGVKDTRASGGYYGHKFSPYSDTGRTSVIYKRSNTLEVRCMDSQGTPEEDVAIAAYIFGIAEKAKEDHANGVEQDTVGNEGPKNFKHAVKKGMEATFKIDDEKVPAYRVVEDTFVDIRHYLERYDCPDEVMDVLEGKVKERRSGADDILDIYHETGYSSIWTGIKDFFTLHRGHDELYDRLAHRGRSDDETTVDVPDADLLLARAA
ncbi:MAG: glutamate-cysteine ligase family protein [Candidatus Undinarchaeales archaeon]|nr:glutamate-cysteine ligase family protein [Candidatus Undinarchaeales archaeon]MDP7491552.1 glutamate-cysteine ligase family protein [Candidatus Undinarchaeales archaeon]